MSANQQDLSTAVVIGGSRGTGGSVSIALSRQGRNVCFSYNSNKKVADETLSGIHAVGRRTLAVQADTANREDIGRLFESAHKAFGRLDALVNKCRNCWRAAFDSGRGRRPPDGGFPHQRDRQFLLRQRGGLGGSIANMSSAAARHGGMLNEAYYAASKGAIDSFNVSLANELAPHGILVNAVRLGLIATEIHEVHGGQTLLDKIGPTVPIGRAGTADEVAQVVAFLAGPLSSYMHGALVDGSGGR